MQGRAGRLPQAMWAWRPHLLEQRQLAEELLGAVLGQEVGPLLAGLGVGPVEVLQEAGLGQGRRDTVLAPLVVGQSQPVAPGEPPGEALQGGSFGSGRPRRLVAGGPSLAQIEPRGRALPPARGRPDPGISAAPLWTEPWCCLHASW